MLDCKQSNIASGATPIGSADVHPIDFTFKVSTLEGAKYISKQPKKAKAQQRESKTRRSRAHNIEKTGDKILYSNSLKHKLDSATKTERLSYIWIEGSSYYKRQLPKEL